MNLAVFYETIAEDPRITITHISLYFALLNEWQVNGEPMLFELDRQSIMKAAKINSRTTYDKTMHGLHDFGYIQYEPFCGCGKSRMVFRRLE